MHTTTTQEAGPDMASARNLETELSSRVTSALHAENAPRAAGSPYTASAAAVIVMRAEDAHPAWYRGPRRQWGELQGPPSRPVRAPLDAGPLTWPASDAVPAGRFTDHWVRQTKVRPSLTFEDAAPNHDGVLTTDKPKTSKARTSKPAARFQITITFGGHL